MGAKWVSSTPPVKTIGKSSYDQNANKMYFDYEVEVSTTKGTYGPVAFKDKIPYQKADHMAKDFKVYKVAADGTRTEVTPNPLKIGEEPDQFSRMDSIITGDLPSLNAGEKYVIQYTAEKQLEAGQQEGDLNNTVEVKGSGENNGDLTGKAEQWQNMVLKDLAVEKTSANPPVINRAEGKITNTYEITVSSESGSAGEITVEDIVTTTGVTGTNISYQNVVVEKVSNGSTQTVEHSLSVDSEGKLTGKLPQLGANESYRIRYDMEMSNLPADAQVTVGVNNKFKVTHGSTSKEDEDEDSIPWVGSGYGNYVKKTGSYKNGVITWEIVVNEKGYQDVNGMVLNDTLNDQLLDGQQVQITTNGKTFNATIPYTFTNGCIFLCYIISSSSTSNISVEYGGMELPAPCSP